MDNAIKIDTLLNGENFQEFNLWFSRTTRLIVNASSMFTYFAIMLMVTKERSTVGITLMAASAVIVAMVLWFISRSNLIRKSKKAFESDNLAQQAQTYTISDDGIEYQSESGQGRMKWEDLHKIGETLNLYVLFVSSNRALLIPKRSFPTAAEATAFKDLARKHMYSYRVKFKG